MLKREEVMELNRAERRRIAKINNSSMLSGNQVPYIKPKN